MSDLNNHFILRRATLADADALRTLCLDDDAAWGYGAPLLQSVDWWRSKIQYAEGRGIMIVAACEDTGEVVAMVQLLCDTYDVVRRHVGILSICVHPEYRGQGLGRQLLTQIVTWAKLWLGITRIELHVWVAHTVALALYESVGFQREGLHREFGFIKGKLEDAYSLATVL